MHSFSFLKRHKKQIFIICLLMAFSGSLYFYFQNKSEPKDVLFQMSQWPLSPMEPHSTILMHRSHVDVKVVELFESSGKLLAEISTREVPSAHQWQAAILTLPALKNGQYKLQTPDKKWTHEFQVGDSSPEQFLISTLHFFSEQRCGVSTETHKECHLKLPQLQGVAVDRDLSGGWHDAGDYIRFFLTSSYATTLMFESLQWLKSEQQQKLVIEQAEWGLKWLDKMWGSQNSSRFMQIGDASDHNHWRLPEDDDVSSRIQAVYPFESAHGANLAGRLSASMAIYSQHCPESERGYWLQRAQEVFVQGQKLEQGSQSSRDHFYQEKSWQEDMALAALELAAVTHQKQYFDFAKKYIDQMSSFWAFGYDQIHPLIFLRAAQILPDQRKISLQKMKQTLERNYNEYLKSKIALAVPKLYWGSQMEIMGVAILALIYQKESGDTKYRQMAVDHWDYTLGRNPWGLSLVSGVGSEWLKTPHHQISDISKKPLRGYWAPGAVHKEVLEKQKILSQMKPDPFVERSTEEYFQTSDPQDYVTNEPTLTAAATGLLFVAMYFANLPSNQ